MGRGSSGPAPRVVMRASARKTLPERISQGTLDSVCEHFALQSISGGTGAEPRSGARTLNSTCCARARLAVGGSRPLDQIFFFGARASPLYHSAVGTRAVLPHWAVLVGRCRANYSACPTRAENGPFMPIKWRHSSALTHTFARRSDHLVESQRVTSRQCCSRSLAAVSPLAAQDSHARTNFCD